VLLYDDVTLMLGGFSPLLGERSSKTRHYDVLSMSVSILTQKIVIDLHGSTAFDDGNKLPTTSIYRISTRAPLISFSLDSH